MVTDFIDAARTRMKDGGFARVKDVHSEEGGTFLVGYAGRLFQISSDFQVGESTHGFDAIGCGSHIALGSLFSSAKVKDAQACVTEALTAAEAFSAGVRGPFHIGVVHGIAHGVASIAELQSGEGVMPGRGRRLWTDEKRRIAERLVGEGRQCRAIAVVVDMSVSAVEVYTRGLRDRQPHPAPETHRVVKVSRPAEVERDERHRVRLQRDEGDLLRGDLTASFFGDPLPGYSALDRKRAGKPA